MFLKSITTRAFKELDSIRFLSIFLVVLHHQFLDQNKFLLWLKSYGWVGVDIFFVMSGFLITSILLKEIEKNQTIELKKFWLKRIFRLWPSWLLVLFISTFLVFNLGRNNQEIANSLASKWWHYYLHFGNYSHAIFDKLHTLFSHFWSLAVEEHFYLIWPILLMGIHRFKKISIFIWLLLLFLPYIFRIYHYPNIQSYAYIKLSTHTRFDELIIGCLLAHGFVKIRNNLNWMVEILLTILTIGFFYLGLNVLHHEKINYLYSELCYLFIGVAASGLIIIALKGNNWGLRKLFQFDFISKLGILSYGVYLVHFITNFIFYGFCAKFKLNLDQNVIAVCTFTLPFFPAYLMYRYIDLPMAKFKHNLK